MNSYKTSHFIIGLIAHWQSAVLRIRRSEFEYRLCQKLQFLFYKLRTMISLRPEQRLACLQTKNHNKLAKVLQLQQMSSNVDANKLQEYQNTINKKDNTFYLWCTNFPRPEKNIGHQHLFFMRTDRLRAIFDLVSGGRTPNNSGPLVHSWCAKR